MIIKILEKLRDKGVFEPVAKIMDKIEPNWDEIERKGNRIIDKTMAPLVEVGDKLDATLGIGDYKYSTTEDRIHTIFSTEHLKKDKAEAGDIIGVSRGLYEHYGIYIGNNRVIHYTSLSSDISSENIIMETDMKHFLKESSKYFIFNCENQGRQRICVKQNALDSIHMWTDFSVLEIYNSEETVERARKRMGESDYSLAFNNCEHFTIWCKTGVSKSYQVDRILGIWSRTHVFV
jgi:hypothetical protein